ncbi:hypothetical protein GKZ89_01265 [Bacillus mangrovi]|uniref:Uncharacterized protein n=1 Tax=Metabacillus mangrovi TaxID=1491830 RepID=A0A7X2V3F0_9BACI|nr:hypothetical protein [Metabacillus mangrovi]MTH52019.1 hypothetical protein [Metabacillus mangrovi]
MNSIVKWIDSDRFDQMLLLGVRVLFAFTIIVCLPYFIWNVCRWLFL